MKGIKVLTKDCDVIDALMWRYAVKRMTGKKIPDEKLNKILEAIRLSATSRGLQPYTIFVISNEECKKKLYESSNRQPQVIECSHLLVFSAWETVTENHVNEYIADMSEVRGIPEEKLRGLKQSLINYINNNPKEKLFQSAARQTYIALGTGMVAAAEEKIDATPMEGFVNADVDAILNLPQQGLRSIVFLALGYRDEERDFLAQAKKVRRDSGKLFIYIT